MCAQHQGGSLGEADGGPGAHLCFNEGDSVRCYHFCCNRFWFGVTLEACAAELFRVGVTMLLHFFREELSGIAKGLTKTLRDTNQMVKGGSALTAKQLRLQVGILPTVADCLDGLQTLSDMHQAE